ncbi:MAG: SRPBCC family protein [Fimbriiglobus sp.]|jgi:carbon monoxide dehydrogenase subunit G|nr:SRPBCC family protein [Fimbriiglobus sp.]
MIAFQGVELFPAPVELVSAKLSDAGFLAANLPDATATSVAPDRAEWKVRPKVAFLSGDLETVATVTDRSPEHVKYRLDTKGVGSGSVVEAELKFAPADDGTGTAVTWAGTVVSMTGLLKLAPKGLVQATAQKVIADCWAALKAKV